MQNILKEVAEIYASYIEGLKWLSMKERNEISRLLEKYKNSKEKNYGKSI